MLQESLKIKNDLSMIQLDRKISVLEKEAKRLTGNLVKKLENLEMAIETDCQTDEEYRKVFDAKRKF